MQKTLGAFLVCDDAEINREIASFMLSDFGREIILAENGAAALDALDARPDTSLILMDLQMPVMDGMTAVSEIRKQKRFDSVKIVALTAENDEHIQNECKKLGFNDILTKPLDETALAQCLKRHGFELCVTAEPPKAQSSGGALFAPEGLARFGGNELKYKNALFSLNREVSANVPLFETMPVKDALFTAHKIKGAAGNLGLASLESAALEYEAQLKNGESVFAALSNLLAECENLSAFCQEIPQEQESAEKKPCTQDEFDLLLSDLQTALEGFNLKECEAAAQAAEAVSPPLDPQKISLLAQIIELTKNYEYTDALDLIETLRS